MPTRQTIVITLIIYVLLMTFSGFCWGQSKEEVFRAMQATASEMNRSLPMMVGSGLKLTTIIATNYDGLNLTYVVKSTAFSIEQLDPRLIQTKIKPVTVNGLCSNPGALAIMRRGIKYTYLLYDKDNRYVTEYSITAKDCGF